MSITVAILSLCSLGGFITEPFAYDRGDEFVHCSCSREKVPLDAE